MRFSAALPGWPRRAWRRESGTEVADDRVCTLERKRSGDRRENELSVVEGTKSGRLERASAWRFSDPGLGLMTKLKLEKNNDHRACRRVNFLVVMK